MDFSKKVIIGCVHLLPMPSAPMYDGNLEHIYKVALKEAEILYKNGVDAFIIENFRDRPLYPNSVPASTVATMAAIAMEIKSKFPIPMGIAVLRNDANAALSIATAVGADFIRVNVHVGAVLTAQGLIEGKSHETLRLKASLKSDVKIYADAMVKHSTPVAYDELYKEIRDLNGISDAVIISGELTGLETDIEDVKLAKESTDMPIIIGSGVTPENLEKVFNYADGFIVGSYFKEGGNGLNFIDETRVKIMMKEVERLRNKYLFA